MAWWIYESTVEEEPDIEFFDIPYSQDYLQKPEEFLKRDKCGLEKNL